MFTRIAVFLLPLALFITVVLCFASVADYVNILWCLAPGVTWVVLLLISFVVDDAREAMADPRKRD